MPRFSPPSARTVDTIVRSARRVGVSFVVSGVAAIVAVQIAAAPAGFAAAARKHHQSTAPQTRGTDTSSTSTIPSKVPLEKQVPDPTAKDDDVLPPPFHLPTASRQRMRDCGRKWQAMKTSGESGEDIWRDFATHCLAAASGPLERRSER